MRYQFELRSCAVVHGSSCGSKGTSLSPNCSWLPFLERSPTGGCVDRHVAMVMVVLRRGCSTAPVVSAAHEDFL